MRIALIGSAPSSVSLAPYGDPSWTIWACSPGAAPFVKRVNAWFELHPLTQPDITPDYVQFMADLRVPVYLIEKAQALPEGVVYPKDAMVEKYSPYFFTSSLSWMFALALEQEGVEEIGLWGVDMAATTEYGQQRPGCHFFMLKAKERGIKVTVPYEADLLRPPPLYGYSMALPMYKKLQVRRDELQRRVDQVANEYENKRNEWNFLKGALDDLDYVQNTWLS